MDKYSFQKQSATIDAMRIPMVILVICIHFNIICYPLVSHGEIVQFELTWVQYPITLFSEVLGRLAVPFFFLTSGYFFFFKDTTFSKRIYSGKVKKRFKSLFIPYVVWWLVAGLLTFIFAKAHLVGNINLKDFIAGFWLNPNTDLCLTNSINTPLDGPLWFLRDLMVTMLLSPIIYYVLKDKMVGCIILLSAIILFLAFGWFGLPQYFIPGISFPCLLFFSIGAYWGIHKTNILNYVYERRLVLVSISLLLIILDLCLSFYNNPLTWSTSLVQNNFVHNAMIVVCTPTAFLLGAICEPKMGWSRRFSSSSFTIFALHKIIILPMGYVLVYILHTDSHISAASALTYYFGIILLAAVIGILFYKIVALNKVSKLLFTGGR